MTYRYGLLAATLILLLTPQNAWAQCTAPASPEGGIDYDTTIDDLIVCDGTNWNTVGYTAGGLWTAGAGDAIYYDTGTYLVGIGTSTPASAVQVIGDVQISNYLKMDGVAGNAPNYPIPTMAITDLSDVVITTPVTNEVLTYNGTNWVNQAAGAGSSLWTDNTTYISRGTTPAGFHVIDAGNTLPAVLDDDGIRAFYYHDKAAFRGGRITVGNTAWQDANIGTNSFAWGVNTEASGANSLAFGDSATASGPDTFAIGQFSTASGDRTIASGHSSSASGQYSIASGHNSTASANQSVASGYNSTASAFRATASGNSSLASANYSRASGYNSTASGVFSTASGNYGTASGAYSKATGYNSTASGYRSSTFGFSANAGTGTAQTTDANAGQGNYSMVFGVGGSFTLPLPQVTGNESAVFFFGDQNGEDITATNVLALEGGSLLLSNDSGTACAANKDGALRLNATSDGLEMCDGGTTTWVTFGGGGASALDDLSDAATTIGDQNMFIGHEGGSYGTNDQSNLGVGYGALDGLTNDPGLNAGTANVGLGHNALTNNNIGRQNVAVGNNTMESNTTGDRNSAFGFQALSGNISGAENAAFGRSALQHITGNNNVAMGRSAGIGVSTSSNISNNVFIGHSSGAAVITGADNNTFIGYQAGDTTTTGSDNILIGNGVDTSAATVSNELNIGNTIYGNLTNDAVAIGTGNTATGANSFAAGTAVNATGTASTSIGFINTASGAVATTLGADLTASGYNALAFGRRVRVGTGVAQTNALFNDVGNFSVAFGVGTTTTANYPQVTGNETFAIFFGNQDGEDITATNVLALEGGSLLLSNDSGTACAANKDGALRLNATSDGLEMCDGGTTTWVAFGGGGANAINDLTDGATTYGGTENIFAGNNAGGSHGATDGSNTAFGIDALASLNNSGGSGNVAFGRNTLTANTSGGQNTAIGAGALDVNTTGSGNTGLGQGTLGENTTGGGNVAVGEDSMLNNTTGAQNVAVGSGSMGQFAASNGDMDNNTAIGYRAGFAFAGGAAGAGPNNNVLLGWQAGDVITTGDNNIIIGYDVDPSAATASNELNIGDLIRGDLTGGDVSIGASTASGGNSFAFGVGSTATDYASFAGGESSDATGNIAFAYGFGADATGGRSIAMGQTIVASGYNSMGFGRNVQVGTGVAQTTTGTSDVGNNSIGFGLGSTLGTDPQVTSNQTAAFFFGDQANSDVTDENSLALVGGKLLIDAVDGGADTDYGCIRYNDTSNALEFADDCDQGSPTWTALSAGGGASDINGLSDAFHDTTTDFDGDAGDDDDNLALGHEFPALDAVNPGSKNTGIGAETLVALTEGDANVAVGFRSAQVMTTGSANTGLGNEAIQYVTTADGNTGVGYRALRLITTGSGNTGLGVDAGRFIADGSTANQTSTNSIYLGPETKAGADGNTNEIVIGYQAIGNGSNTVTLGNTLITETILRGEVGIGTNAPEKPLDVRSNVSGNNIMRIQNENATGWSTMDFHNDAGAWRMGIGVGNTGQTGIFQDRAFISFPGAMSFITGASELMRVQDAGGGVSEIGIGNFVSDTIDSKLHIQSGEIRLDGGAANEAGCIRFDDTTDQLEWSNDCTTYSAFGGGGASDINGLSDGITDYTTDFNMFMGDSAGAAIAVGGQYNLGIGQNSLAATTTGDFNVAYGYNTMSTNVAGNETVAIGHDAMRYANDSGTDQDTNNTAVGVRALMGSTTASANTGRYNTAFGNEAMRDNTSAQFGTGLGQGALRANATGNNNVAVGAGVMLNFDAGDNNTAVGTWSMLNSTGGDRNSALGYRALQANTTGTHNTAIGGFSLIENLDGIHNSGLGYSSLQNVTSGSNNIGVGYRAGDVITTGDNNIIIGYDVDASAATASDELNIGNAIYGDLANNYIGIANATPSVELDVTGDIEYTGTITDVSDRRLKENINALNSEMMLDQIAKLKTYSFQMKDRKNDRVEYGVIAQEIEGIFPELVHTDTTTEEAYKSVNYIGLISPIIESVKELYLKVTSNNRRISVLEDENRVLKTEVETLKQQNHDILKRLDAIDLDKQASNDNNAEISSAAAH